MRAAAYTCYVRERDIKETVEAFRTLHSLGITEADIIDDELKSLPLREYLSALDYAGMRAGAIVSVDDILAPGEVLRGAAYIRIKALIDEMSSFGIPELMLAPPIARDDCGERDEIIERMLSTYGKIIGYAKERGVRVSIENQSSEHRPDSKITDIEYLLEKLPDLYFTLDAGNFLCVGEDVISAYERVKSRTVRAHIKDWTCAEEKKDFQRNMIRRGDLTGCAIGDGILPLGELIKRMREGGLDVGLTLEINAPRITADMIERSAKRLVSFINS